MKPVALFLAAAGLLLAACSPAQPAAPVTPDEARLAFFEGQVTVDGQPGKLGAVLTAQSLIVTGPDGLAELTIGPRNILKLGPSASLRLDLTKPIREVQLDQGALTSVLRGLPKLLGKDDSFRVRTPAIVAGVRGTSFFIQAEGEKTYLCACNGSVSAEPGNGQPDVDLVAHHHAAREFAKTAGGLTITEAGMIYHTDDDLNSLAQKIGQTIDWTKPD